MVWLPDFETLLPGDLFYWSFPMLASPGKPDRPVLEWAASLDRMRQLHPAFLAGSHSRPLAGRERDRCGARQLCAGHPFRARRDRETD